MRNHHRPQLLIWDYTESSPHNPGFGIMIYEPEKDRVKISILHFNERWQEVDDFNIEYQLIKGWTSEPFKFQSYL